MPVRLFLAVSLAWYFNLVSSCSWVLISDAGGDQELKKLLESREVRSYKKKSEIYREGDYPLYLFCVIKGKIKTFKTNDDDKKLIINIYDKNDYLGYVDLL